MSSTNPLFPLPCRLLLHPEYFYLLLPGNPPLWFLGSHWERQITLSSLSCAKEGEDLQTSHGILRWQFPRWGRLLSQDRRFFSILLDRHLIRTQWSSCMANVVMLSRMERDMSELKLLHNVSIRIIHHLIRTLWYISKSWCQVVWLVSKLWGWNPVVISDNVFVIVDMNGKVR